MAMLLGLYQTPSPAGDTDAALATLDTALRQAAEVGVDMLVLPELFLPGYAHAVANPVGPDLCAEVAALCQAHGVALTLGIDEQAESGRSNTAMSFDAAGTELARYRKIQLFGPGESAAFQPGDAYVTFDYKGVRFGLLICYDVEFPEHVRALAARGAQVILVPTANMMPYVNVNQVLVPARACENALTIVYANYCGSERDLDYVGSSVIAGPDGYPLAIKGTGAGLAVAELPNDWSERGIPDATQRADLKVIDG